MRRHKRVLFFIGGLLILMSLLFLVVGLASETASTERSPGLLTCSLPLLAIGVALLVIGLLSTPPLDVERLKARGNTGGLVKALGYKKEAGVRQAAAKALGQLGDVQAVEALTATLADVDAGVRSASAAALGEIGDPRAVEPLIAAVKDTNADVCQAAAKALGQIGDARAVEPLTAALKGGGTGLHQVSVQALGQIGDARAVRPIIAVLGDSVLGLRKTAARALVTLYRSSELGDDGKREILALRADMTQRHQDTQRHTDEGTRITWTGSSDCITPHTDRRTHTDTGIGIDFPI